MTEMDFKGKSYKIRKYSTADIEDMVKRYGSEEDLQDALSKNTNEIALAEIIYLLSDDELKKDYPTEKDFKRAMYDIESKKAVIITAWDVIKKSMKFDLTEEEKKEAELNKKKQKKSKISLFGLGRSV